MTVRILRKNYNDFKTFAEFCKLAQDETDILRCLSKEQKSALIVQNFNPYSKEAEMCTKLPRKQLISRDSLMWKEIFTDINAYDGSTDECSMHFFDAFKKVGDMNRAARNFPMAVACYETALNSLEE
ncbi:MAG: hypothetical protein RL664_1884, partial [Bacteroidota bacterium]